MDCLDQTDVCTNCGAVTWFGQMHTRRRRLTLIMQTAPAVTTPRPVKKARPPGRNKTTMTVAQEGPVLTPPPSPAKPPVVSRETALAFYAAGRSAAGRRALAAVPAVVEAYAELDHISAEQERAVLLAVADGIEQVTAEGLTRADAWYLAGLDQFQGPYPGSVAAA